MHAEARAFIDRAARCLPPATWGLDIGGRDVNGTGRDAFGDMCWHVVDLLAAPDVTYVADAADWQPPRHYDVVLCTEVAEHTPTWPAIISTAAAAGDCLVFTAACAPRAPHSALDGGPLGPGEFYENVDPDRLLEALGRVGFTIDAFEVDDDRGDVYALARQ